MAAIDTKVRVLTATASTSSSTVDMSSSGAGDAAWYILFITGDYSDGGTDTGAAKVSMGFGALTSDTAADQASFGCSAETNVDPQNTANRGATAISAIVLGDDGTFLSDYIRFNQRITDGIRFRFNDGGNAGTTYRLCAIVGFGDGWQADVGTYTSSATEDTETTETLKAAFTDTPEALFIGGSDHVFDNSIRNGFHCALGWTNFVVESGTDDYEQACTSFSVRDNVAAPDGNSRRIGSAGISGRGGWAGDRVYVRAAGPGSLTAELEVTGVGAGEFSITTREESVAVPVMYLALSSGGVLQMSSSLWDMSSATGDVDYSEVSWIPQAYLAIFGLINFADVDGGEETGNVSRVQVFAGADKEGDEFSCGWRIRNNAANHNESYGDSTKVLGTRNHNDNLTHEGAHSSMNADGFTINVTDGLANNPAVPVFLWSEPTVTLTPTGLDAGLAFGAPRPSLLLNPAGLDAGLVLGGIELSVLIEPAGLDAALVIGEPTLDATAPTQTINPTGLAVPIAFGAITPSLLLSPSGLEVGIALGSITPTLRINPDGLDAVLDFGSPTLTPTAPGQTISPDGLAVSVAFGGPSLRVRVALAGLDAGLAFGSPSLAVRLALAGLDAGLAFGGPTLATTQPVAPTGLSVPLAFGEPSLAARLAPTGLAVAPAFGNPALALTIGPAGLAVEVTFGPLSISGPLVIAPSPAFNVVQSGAVAGIVSQSGMIQANAVQSGMVAAQVSQSGMVAGQVTQSGLTAGGVA